MAWRIRQLDSTVGDRRCPHGSSRPLQTRLTKARANHGFSGCFIHRMMAAEDRRTRLSSTFAAAQQAETDGFSRYVQRDVELPPWESCAS